MNVLKRSAFITIFATASLPVVQAKEVETLPNIHVMAESELREEVGFVPFQEDKQVRQALRRRIDKIQTDLQNSSVESMDTSIDYQPTTTTDISHLSPFLQAYITSIVTGLQSSDPIDGIFNMLEPIDINRNNIDSYRDGTRKVNIDNVLKLQQQIQNGLGKN